MQTFFFPFIYPSNKKKVKKKNAIGERGFGYVQVNCSFFLNTFQWSISTVAQDQPKELFISHSDDTNPLGIIPPEAFR